MICDNWRCATHTGDDVWSLWYVNVMEEKENLKEEKFWVTPEVFYVYHRIVGV